MNPSSATTTSPTTRPIRCIGVVGLGHMGEEFAENLLSDLGLLAAMEAGLDAGPVTAAASGRT